MSTSNDKVVFNIGGTKFETYKSTLRRIPQIIEHGDYFFDRDPNVFKSVLQYLRTGQLHLPSSTCGSAIKTELEFWGVEESTIEDCCWLNYNSWSQTLDNLKKLEKDRQVTMGSIRHEKQLIRKSRRYLNNGWQFLNNPNWNLWSKIYGAISVIFVFLSIFSYVAFTHEYFQVQPLDELIPNTTADNSSQWTSEKMVPVHPLLFTIDCVCFIFFLLEIIVRFVCCPYKVRFCTRPMNIIDFLALLPDVVAICASWVGVFPVGDSGLKTFILLVRVMRVLRIFRLMRFFPGLWLLFYTLKASINELLLMLLFVIIGMLVFSSLIYYAEERENFPKRENFPSIPQAFWWAIITMTTVGYGDVSPVTNLGYLVGSMTAISGLLLIGFTVPVLVNNFILYYNHTQLSRSVPVLPLKSPEQTTSPKF
ncbi:hypothetical protein LOTGIDRAFT_179090 [Lottia gigantea]|uniref:BTB domain-containing protein n=1 Tax=Lottia gigantea TaxID=225164 RepID=V3ZVR2_LOTGI|nr:hypothetical protein LOTGIDRAFT_179090 [Lottia gigantea]ESO88437.1 hypothetical protein LOTGIDRAFT_179090 [Lottia gigantea]